MTRHVSTSFLVVIALVVLTGTSLARTWTDRQGRTVDAEFVGLKDGKVTIKRNTEGGV